MSGSMHPATTTEKDDNRLCLRRDLQNTQAVIFGCTPASVALHCLLDVCQAGALDGGLEGTWRETLLWVNGR